MTPEESAAWKPELPGGSTDILPWQAEHFSKPSAVLPEGGTYLEVGCFFGRSLSHIGLLRPDVKLIACDPWADEWEDAGETLPLGPDRERRDKYGGMYEAFLAGLAEHAPELLEGMQLLDLREMVAHGVDLPPPSVLGSMPLPRLTVLRGPSREVLRVLGDASVDVAFLDGDHSMPGLLADISHAKRLVKPGGIISGHDFHIAAWGSEVTRAVRLAFGVGGFELAPWPYAREGWEPGCSSVWLATKW